LQSLPEDEARDLFIREYASWNSRVTAGSDPYRHIQAAEMLIALAEMRKSLNLSGSQDEETEAATPTPQTDTPTREDILKFGMTPVKPIKLTPNIPDEPVVAVTHPSKSTPFTRVYAAAVSLFLIAVGVAAIAALSDFQIGSTSSAFIDR
jgi:hypothetical protein